MFQKWWNFSLAPRHYQAQFHAFKFFFSSFGRNRGARKGATIVHNDHDYRARFTIKHNYELHFRFMLATGNRTCSRDLVLPHPKSYYGYLSTEFAKCYFLSLSCIWFHLCYMFVYCSFWTKKYIEWINWQHVQTKSDYGDLFRHYRRKPTIL